jgi:hypothetical protein
VNRLLLFVLLFGAAHIACGQKGAPLAPIVLLPRPVSEVVVKRIENDIVLQFQVPTLNTDGSGPADLRKIEVYGHTGPLPKPEDFIKYGDLVASLEIKEPPKPVEPGAMGAEGAEGATPAEGVAGAPDVAGTTEPVAPKQDAEDAAKVDADAGLLEQGHTTMVRETLTPKHREIGAMPPVRPPPPPDPDAPVVVVEKIETPGTVNFELPPQRYYVMVGVSDSRNKRGPFAGPIQVALLEPLTPPEKIDFSYTPDALSLKWPGGPEDIPMTTPVGLNPKLLGISPDAPAAAALVAPAAPIAPIALDPPLDRETEGTRELYADVETDDTDDVLVAVIPSQPTGAKPKPTQPLRPQPPPTPRFGYNVYELGALGAAPATLALDTLNAPNAPSAPSAPILSLNATLLTAPGFDDPRVEFGVERCYVVRRVQMVGSIAVESAPSAPTCVTPVDTFPPAPPKSLALIAGGNGVSLLWEANTEADLGGYLVLRGEAPGDKLSPLTKEPINETSYLDTTARRGRTYVYRVVAVDRSTPPNRSAPSDAVEETIR